MKEILSLILLSIPCLIVGRVHRQDIGVHFNFQIIDGEISIPFRAQGTWTENKLEGFIPVTFLKNKKPGDTVEFSRDGEDYEYTLEKDRVPNIYTERYGTRYFDKQLQKALQWYFSHNCEFTEEENDDDLSSYRKEKKLACEEIRKVFNLNLIEKKIKKRAVSHPEEENS